MILNYLEIKEAISELDEAVLLSGGCENDPDYSDEDDNFFKKNSDEN